MQKPLGHVFLIDDNPDIRFHLGDLLAALGYTVELFENAESFVAQSLDLSPAVILLDMRMPGLSGLDLQRRLKDVGRATPIIFMSGESKQQEIIDAMKEGAIDFLCKPFNRDQLVAAIEQALARDVALREQFIRLTRLKLCFDALTEREREVFFLIIAGHANRNIGELTGIQAGTVKKHRAVVFDKMGVTSTAELIAACKGLDVDSLKARRRA